MLLKLDLSRLACADATPVQMTVTVPSSLAEFIKERARKKGPPSAELAGQLLEDAFVHMAEQEMVELRLDPKTLNPFVLQEAYSGNYDHVSVSELASMTGLDPAYLVTLADKGCIPGHDSDGSGYRWFYRDEVVPWLLSDEFRQLLHAQPGHHAATP